MIKYNIRIFIFIILGLFVATYIIIFLITQDLESINFKKVLSHIPTVITINVVIRSVFINWDVEMENILSLAGSFSKSLWGMGWDFTI